MPALVNGVGVRRHAFAQLRTLVQFAVINRRAAQFDAKGPCPCRHDRAGVRAVPGRALGAPAFQRQPGFAQQRVSQRHQTRRNVIEHVVDLRRRPAEPFEALIAIAPHRIQRIAQAIEHHARRTGHGKPEQRGEHRVTTVFQHRLGGGTGDFGFIQVTGFTADQITHTFACFIQIIAAQGLGHRRDVLTEAAHAEGAIERENLDDPADIRRPGECRGQQRQWQHGNHPRGDAMAAPAATAAVETLLDALGKTAERHQRMPAFGFTQQRIQRNRGDTQQRHTH
ncbi:hypothetical protein D3C75_623470 [compost metagenome]